MLAKIAESRCGAIGHVLAGQAHQHAADRRPHHQSDLEHHAADAGAARELFALEHACEQGAVYRPEERTHAAAQGDGRVDRPHAATGRPAQGDQREQQRGGRKPGAGRHAQLAARQVIDQIPGERRHAEERNHLGQSDQAERERIAGEFVHVPADRDRHDLVAQDRADAIEHQLQEGGVAQR
jgi:hypothetical protein